MKLKTITAALASFAAVAAFGGFTATSALADTGCVNPSVQVGINPGQVQVTVGTTVNYNFQFCYNTNSSYYTVQVFNEVPTTTGTYTNVDVTPANTVALSGLPGSTSGVGSYTPAAPGVYEVEVSYYMQGQTQTEDWAATKFFVSAAPTPPAPTPPVTPIVPTGTPTPPPPSTVTPTGVPTVPTPVVTPTVPKPKVVKVSKPKPKLLKPAGTPRARLTLTKTADVKTAAAGSDVRYTLVVGNSSDIAARKVEVCDALPASTLYVSASRSVDFHGADACFAIGTLAKHAHAAVVITLQVAASAHGVITNHALATAANANSATAQASINVPAKPTTFVPAPVTG